MNKYVLEQFENQYKQGYGWSGQAVQTAMDKKISLDDMEKIDSMQELLYYFRGGSLDEKDTAILINNLIYNR